MHNTQSAVCVNCKIMVLLTYQPSWVFSPEDTKRITFTRNGLSLRFCKAKEAYSKQKIGLIYYSGRIPFRR